MKNYIKYIIPVFIGLSCVTSCNDDEDLLQINPSSFVAPELKTISSTNLVLTEETQNDLALTIDWTNASFGIDTEPRYSVEIVKEGDSFDNAYSLTNTTTTSLSLTGKSLNEAVAMVGLLPDEEGVIEYRIVAGLGTYSKEAIYSPTYKFTITPFTTSLKTDWGLVGQTNGWENDIAFWKTDTANLFVTYAQLNKNDPFKFRKNKSWAENFGGDAEGNLSASLPDIITPADGYYKITFNLKDSKYKLEPYQWGIVGSATPNGWVGPDLQKLTFNSEDNTWVGNATFNSGLIKFRVNDRWTIKDTGGSDGVLNGNDIPVTTGTYNIVIDFIKNTYTLTETTNN